MNKIRPDYDQAVEYIEYVVKELQEAYKYLPEDDTEARDRHEREMVTSAQESVEVVIEELKGGQDGK